MSTTLTLTDPNARRPADRPSAELGVLAAVGVDGSLRLLPVPAANGSSARWRHSRPGTAVRFDLGAGITCWLDSDQQDGSGILNWVATGMCTSLIGGAFTGPHDAPFVCGLALFAGDGEVFSALSEWQLRRIVDAHAAAEETTDAAHEASLADATVDDSWSLAAMR